MQNWIEVEYYNKHTGVTTERLINLVNYECMMQGAIPDTCVFYSPDGCELIVKEDYEELKTKILKANI